MVESQPGSEQVTVSATFDSRVIWTWPAEELLEWLECVLHQLDGIDSGKTIMGSRSATSEVWGCICITPALVGKRFVHDMLKEPAQTQPTATLCISRLPLALRKLSFLHQ